MVDDLICTIGPDGSGKSTRSELLGKDLDRRGIEYAYRWFRFRHYRTLLLLRTSRVMGLSEVEELENGRRKEYHYFYESRLISFLYPRILFIDMFVRYLVNIWPVIVDQSNIVLADRYVYHTLVHIAISTGKPEFHRTRLARWLLKSVPAQSTVMVLLDEAEVLRKRRDEVAYDAIIQKKFEQYTRLAEDPGLEVVDASLPIREVRKEINRNVFDTDLPKQCDKPKCRVAVVTVAGILPLINNS